MNWEPLVLTEQKVVDLWNQIRAFPMVFDDFSRDRYDLFVAKLFNPANVFVDIGPGLGLAAGVACTPRLDTVLHLVMFDRRLRGREPVFHEIMQFFFERLQLRRMTAMIADDCRTALRLVERLGFKHEGVMRQAMLKEGQYVDVYVYGILREELAAITKHGGDSPGPVATDPKAA